jgi:DNA helicase-2/ATP-dependent DNA helicase PcrA
MSELAALNAPQTEAAAHTEGPLLVFAGAGSGKTRVITFRIANLLSQHRVPPYRILAVTFTNKAAGGSKALQLAGAEVTRLWAGTFHSVCARSCGATPSGPRAQFVIYDESDQKAMVPRLLKQRGLDDRRMPPRWVLSKIHTQKREGRGPGDLDRQSGFDAELIDLFEGYERALRTSNAVDFEDLIVLAMRVAEDPESAAGRELRQRFSYVLVDEFQDTNLTQYRLVRALSASTRNLCVVGDDDQSIYRWRGADVRIIRGFRRDFPDAAVVKLEQNYRSTANIGGAGVIAPALERAKQLWTAAALGDRCTFARSRKREEAAFVVRTVRGELERGVDKTSRCSPRARPVARARRALAPERSVPDHRRHALLRARESRPGRLPAPAREPQTTPTCQVINVPARGIGDKTVDIVLEAAAERALSAFEALSALVHEGALTGAAKAKLTGFVELMEQLRAAASQLTPSELAGRVLEETGYRKRLREEDSAESDARQENLQELIGSIREYEEDADAKGEPA